MAHTYYNERLRCTLTTAISLTDALELLDEVKSWDLINDRIVCLKPGDDPINVPSTQINYVQTHGTRFTDFFNYNSQWNVTNYFIRRDFVYNRHTGERIVDKSCIEHVKKIRYAMVFYFHHILRTTESYDLRCYLNNAYKHSHIAECDKILLDTAAVNVWLDDLFSNYMLNLNKLSENYSQTIGMTKLLEDIHGWLLFITDYRVIAVDSTKLVATCRAISEQDQYHASRYHPDH